MTSTDLIESMDNSVTDFTPDGDMQAIIDSSVRCAKGRSNERKKKSGQGIPDGDQTLSAMILDVGVPRSTDPGSADDNGWRFGSMEISQADCTRLRVSKNMRYKGLLGVAIDPGARVVLHGRFIDDPKYGLQFDIAASEIDMGADSGGMASFIANNPEIKNIGLSRAERLVEAYGENLPRASAEDPAAVAASIPGLSAEDVMALARVLNESAEILQTQTWLSGLGLTHYQVTRIVNTFGVATQQTLRENPYRMIDAINGFGFQRADEISLRLGVPKSDRNRIEAGILYVIEQDVIDQGHIWITRDDLIRAALKRLAVDALNGIEIMAASIDSLCDDGRLCQMTLPILEDTMQRSFKAITTPAHRHCEVTFGRAVRENARDESPHADRFDISEIAKELAEAGSDVSAYPAQQEAILNALRYKISIISGPAGTGKTHIQKRIIDILQESGISRGEILMAAPTGKAAQRMTEATGHPAKTLHRLLECVPGQGWMRCAERPLDAAVVIVDEFSMADSALAWRLIDAIDFEITSLILIGDHNQLPPVGPGYPLRDLILAPDVVPKVILSHVIRQAGILKANSTRILQGVVAATPTQEELIENEYVRADGGAGESPWIVFTHDPSGDPQLSSFGSHDELLRFLDRAITAYARRDMGFDAIREIQVLAPKRDSAIGVRALNERIQRIIQRERFNRNIPDSRGDGEGGVENKKSYRPSFYPGDKVMQTANDYELNIMNGQIGYVVDAPKNGVLFVEFNGGAGGVVEIPRGKIKNLMLAYCCTVHKFQGSQMPMVIVICHSSHTYMLNRNLLYTAVTRAQTRVVILGDKKGIKRAVEKMDVGSRRTILQFLRKSENVASEDVASDDAQEGGLP